MSQWTPKYSDDERSAIEYAYSDLRIRPVPKIVALALAGELRSGPGQEKVASFEIPAGTARSIGEKADRRKRGDELPKELGNKPPRDRAEALQLRLTAIADRELRRIEKQQAKSPSSPVDAEQLRKLGRALREIAALPDPHEKRLPPTPGEGSPEGRTRDDLYGKMIAASDASVPLTGRPEYEQERAPRQRGRAGSAQEGLTETQHPEQQLAQPAQQPPAQPPAQAQHTQRQYADGEGLCSRPGDLNSGLSADRVLITMAQRVDRADD